MKQVTLGIVLIIFTASGLFAQQWTTSGSNIYNSNTGNVGIGTTAPGTKLEVVGGITSSGANAAVVVGTEMSIQNSVISMYNYNSSIYAPSGVKFTYWDGSAVQSSFKIGSTGNVGIGTSTPGAMLDVNGTTYSRKLYVGTPDANTITYMGSNNLLAVNGTAVFVKAKVAVYGSTWPDYVFSQNYKLTPLDSLEQFIQLNKHLPEMPTADDVKKNGIDLGDNQTLLLKKIEELTLIVIEQNKRIEKLELLRNKEK